MVKWPASFHDFGGATLPNASFKAAFLPYMLCPLFEVICRVTFNNFRTNRKITPPIINLKSSLRPFSN